MCCVAEAEELGEEIPTWRSRIFVTSHIRDRPITVKHEIDDCRTTPTFITTNLVIITID